MPTPKLTPEPGRLTKVPTGEGTSLENDVADPHPAQEEHPYKAPHPGGVHSRHDINRVNDAVTDGSAPPRPDNAETTP